MKKEVILAIVFGLIVGLIVTFIVYFTRHRNDSTQQDNTTANKITLDPIDSLNDQDATASPVKIAEPLNESVQTDKTISVSGEAFPDSYAVIFINDQEKITLTDNAGQFKEDVDLESGSNIIGVYVIDEDGETYHNQITVIYSNKSLEENLVSDSEVTVTDDDK